MDFQRLQAGLRVSRVRPVTKVERAIRQYSEDFRQDGDIGRFIKRCRYLAFKSEPVVERDGEEQEEEEEVDEALTQQDQDQPSTPVQQQPLNPSTPGTVPARRTRARRRLHTQQENAASQPTGRVQQAAAQADQGEAEGDGDGGGEAEAEAGGEASQGEPGGDNQQVCFICLSANIPKSARHIILPCKHKMLHSTCYNRWKASGHDTCPICRGNIEKDMKYNKWVKDQLAAIEASTF